MYLRYRVMVPNEEKGIGSEECLSKQIAGRLSINRF